GATPPGSDRRSRGRPHRTPGRSRLGAILAHRSRHAGVRGRRGRRGVGATVSPKQPDMNDLLKQAQKMQEQLMEAQAAAAEQDVEGQAGGGAVKVRVTGGMDFTSVSIDPAAVDAADVSMLEDLVLAAIHDAVGKVNEISQRAVGGLDLGGLGGIFNG